MLHDKDNEAVSFFDSPLAWSCNKLRWLLIRMIFFLLVSSPVRSWVIEAENSESHAPKTWDQLKKRVSNLLPSLPSWTKCLPVRAVVGAVIGALAFTAYYYFVMRLEQGFKMLSQISVPPEVEFTMRTVIAPVSYTHLTLPTTPYV